MASRFRFLSLAISYRCSKTWLYTAIAISVFSLGGLIAWWYGWQDPSFLALVVPEDLIHKVRDQKQLWMGSILGMEPLASSGIMINNLSVTFRMVGSAITAGLFTLYALFTNGLLMGAIAIQEKLSSLL
jgi:uncharacterized membrane protein SpoIIM required for sporulation